MNTATAGGFTYDCQNVKCETPGGLGTGMDVPDELFPTPEQVKQGMDPEICVNCQS